MRELNDAVEKYLSYKRASNLRANSIKSYTTILSRFVLYLQKHKIIRLMQIQPLHITGYVGSRLDKGVKDTSVFTERAVCIGWVKWMTRCGLAVECHWDGKVDNIRVDKKTPRFLTEDESRQLLDVCQLIVQYRERMSKKRDVCMIAMLLDTGLREGELLSMKFTDMDMKTRSIKISAESKGRKERTVWFSEKTLTYLRAYILEHPTGARRNDFVWVTKFGKRLASWYIWTIVKRAARLADLEKVTVHTLRHTAATLMLRYGLPVTDVQRILGHSDISMTMRYVHLLDDDVRVRYQSCCPMDRLAS